VIALAAAEGWTEYADDLERTHRAPTAPGATTLVAIPGDETVGALLGISTELAVLPARS
jgi:hypothetical protein